MSIETIPVYTKHEKDKANKRQDHGTRGNVFSEYISYAQERSAGARRQMLETTLREGLADTSPADPNDTLDFIDELDYKAELALRDYELSLFDGAEDGERPDTVYEDEIPEELLLPNRTRRAKLALSTFSQLDPEADKDFRDDEDYPDGFSITRQR